MSLPEKQAFEQRFESCQKHGEYKQNKIIEGVEYWIAQCPSCRRELLNKQLAGRSAIPPKFEDSSFENYIVENKGQAIAKQKCIDYAESFKPDARESGSMIMFGKSGTGKNHLATAILKKVMLAGYTATYIQLFDYLEKFWSFKFGSERTNWIAKLASVDLLMIDEIGRASVSVSANNALFKLLQERALNLKPTIVATNLGLSELENLVGTASYNRLCEYGSIAIPFVWKKYKAPARVRIVAAADDLLLPNI